MGKTRKLALRCPDCQTHLVVDSKTGEVLSHRPAQEASGEGRDFDSLLAGLKEEKDQAEDIFDREVAALKDHDRLMDQKFEEALERARESPDDEPPVRPFDLD